MLFEPACKAGFNPHAGGAIVASKLALCAALVKAGTKTPAGAPTADQAAAPSKRIVLGLGRSRISRSAKQIHGRAEEFCDGEHKFFPRRQSAVGLQIATGIIFSVHAQDLLQSIGALNAKEAGELNSLHVAMFDLIREAS
jgi:hypothetical protein